MYVRTFLAFVVSLVAATGCGPQRVTRACMGGDAGPLVTDAAMVRLDVYGANAHCVDGLLGSASGPPLMSRSFSHDQAITLDVPPGKHALVLTTFSDDMAMQPIGQGCTEDDFNAGAQLCFDLLVTAVPDGGVVMPGNCPNGCAANEICCGTACVPNDVANCGSCGRACDQAHSNGASCTASGCVYSSCHSGYADCNTAEGNANGCESHLDDDAANCGACGRSCSAAHVAAAHCAGGVCDSTCAAGFGNCSQPAAGATVPYTTDDGCESNLTTCTGGACCSMTMPTPAGMCAPPASHVNCDPTRAECATAGLTQTFGLCAPLGVPGNESTYTLAMALAARASAPAGTDTTGNCGSSHCINRIIASKCTAWCYENDTTNNGYGAIAGHVFSNTKTNGCFCPDTNDPTWF